MPTDVLSEPEIARLLAISSDARAAVLVRMLVLEGFALAEILALDHADIAGTRRSLSAHLHRHGRRQAFPLHFDTCSAVTALQAAVGASGPLLTAARPTDTGQRITRFGADYLIKQCAAEAGFTTSVSANVLRRSHVVVAHRAGIHILDTRDRMGHRDVRTTHRHLTGEFPNPQ